MTTEEIKQWLSQYAISKGWGTDDDTLKEILTEGKSIQIGEANHHRWYYSYEHIVKIEDKYFSFEDARTTSDNSLCDTGYEFTWSHVREVKPVQKTITVYE